DTPSAEFRSQLHDLADWIADYREKIGERPISSNVQPGEILSQLDRDAPETGTSFEKIFAEIDRVIVPGVVHWDHPQFMSYFGCTTTNPGILAEMITGALNVNTMTWRTAPAGTELETLVLDWLRQWLQLPREFTGVVYDTASISTMHPLATALKPLAVVATVGTTSTASVDPVPEIAKICRQHKMWLHIDGAYGAGLALLPECKSVTAGWNEADSIVVNPHKMLFVPFDFSALYLRDIGRLRRLFTLAPEYVHLRDPDKTEINYMDYGVQLGRRFRALKAWVVWRAFGREGIAARIRDHLRLANLLVDWIKADKRFELAAPVVMPVVCFRF